MVQIAHKLASTIRSPEFIARHRTSDKHFTRNRALTFPRLIALMLNQMKSSAKIETERLFKVLHATTLSPRELSAAAFSKARKKLKASAFVELNQALLAEFYRSPWVKRWHGYRLLAIDGSSVELPSTEALLERFGKPSNHTRHPVARLSQLYDLENRLTVDLQLAPFAIGERDLACRHLTALGAGDLLLLDRGYQAFWLFAAIRQSGAHFCARLTADFNAQVRAFAQSSSQELSTYFASTPYSDKQCRARGIATEPLPVRLIKVPLPGGETEILVSSISEESAPPHHWFKALYHRRWGIEEDYKIMKSRLQIENFSGLSDTAVEQDIRAKVLTKNLAALVVIEANALTKQRSQARRHAYRINFSYVLSTLRDTVVRMLMGLWTAKELPQLLRLAASATHAMRKNRAFPRNTKAIRRTRYKMAYKTVG